MSVDIAATHTLLIGIGNILLTDDGVGVHVIRELDALKQAGDIGHAIALRHGGTIGLALLAEFKELGALVVIDAMEIGAESGTVRARTILGKSLLPQLYPGRDF